MIFNYSLTHKHNPNYYGDQPIAVVANFSKDGRVIPIYFRYVSPDCSEYNYRIHGIRHIKDKHDGFSFCCVFHNGDMEQQVILTFKYKECIWLLDY